MGINGLNLLVIFSNLKEIADTVVDQCDTSVTHDIADMDPAVPSFAFPHPLRLPEEDDR